MGRAWGQFGGSGYVPGDRMTLAVRSLILANSIIFLVTLIGSRLGGGDAIFRVLGLVPAAFWRGMLWQPVTYLFLHLDLWHILFNMLCLWFFGRDVEEQWGPRAFLWYYFVCGIGAGLCVAAFGFGDTFPTVGASGAIFGLLLAFAVLFPDRTILFMLLFPMPAKYAAALFGLIELLILVGSGPNAGGVSQVAHLGGAVVGFVYLRYSYSVRLWWFERADRRRRRRAEEEARREGEWRAFITEELDPILDKINREGIHTLTEEEKKILRRAKGRSPRRDQR